MIKPVDIKIFEGVNTYADLEDIPQEHLTVLKNLRPIHGKLVKTYGIGEKITIVAGADNLHTLIHDDLIDDEKYIAVVINNSTFVVTMYGYESGNWVSLGVLSDFVIVGTYYHKNARNPMFQDSDILRILPGNTGKPDDTNEAKGVWIGHIDRDYFDENYSPDAKFYGYATEIAPPNINFTVTQHGGGGFNQDGNGESKYYKFSYVYDGIQESLLSDILGINFLQATFPRIDFTLTKSTYHKRVTALKVYRSDDDKGIYNHIHTIDFLRKSGDVICDSFGAHSGRRMIYIPELSDYDFSNTKKYRIHLYDNIQGGYYQIKLRKAGGSVSAAATANSGTKTKFTSADHGLVAGDTVTHADFNESTYNGDFSVESVITDTYTIAVAYVSTDTGRWYRQGASFGTGFEYFALYTGQDDMEFECFNFSWKLQEDTAIVRQNLENGSYAGHGVIFVNEDTGYNNLLGGVIIFDNSSSGSVTQVEDEGVDQTKYTSASHGLSAGDTVTHSGFTVSSYNGTFVVESAETHTYILDVPFISTDTGSWSFAGVTRIIDSNDGEAVHVTGSIGQSSINKAWKILLPDKGLYIVEDDTTTVDYSFYDTGLADGAEHPLGGEVSIKVNGKFAKIVNGRLWQGDIVLDPGGDNEPHADWASYSELHNYDVNPVSNVRHFPDREGGGITGIGGIFGNPVILKKQAVVTVHTKSYPGEPARWHTIESAHNIGNLAEQGSIEAAGCLYVCYIDGVYRLKPNNLAETDMTPTERLRVSEPIGDVYNALTLTQKEAIKASYDPKTSEIIFTFGSAVWAFNIDTENWREIDSAISASFFSLDENSQTLVVDSSRNKIHSFDIKEAVGIALKLKTFSISEDRPEIVRYAAITYKSASALTLNLYAENAASPVKTFTLPIQTTLATYKLPIRYRAKKFTIEVIDAVDSTTVTEIHEISIEHE